MAAKRYIVAVSGGVDSVVLLHKIVSATKVPGPGSPTYIVAHFDHGIREDSPHDAEFVRQLAASYNLEYVTERVELGIGASEEEARKARYDFLESCLKAYQAEAIITAHHQDDVVETILVNILRGTSPRGLIGFSRSSIVRPFLQKPKSWIMQYAQDHNLEWREDSTNTDETYLRNYIRLTLLPRLSDRHIHHLIETRERVSQNYMEIDDQIKKLIVQITNKNEIDRSRFVTLPFSVQKELVATLMRLQNCTLNKQMIERIVIAVKTLIPEKKLDLGQGFELHTYKHTVAIVKNH